MIIENAQILPAPDAGSDPTTIRATINGQVWCVPVAPGNLQYDEILRQEISIADPD